MTVRKYTVDGARLRAGFTPIPNLVLRDPGLSVGAKTLYATFLDLAWREAEPEQEELAGALGVTAKPLRNMVKELEAAGLVTVKRRGQGKTNAYVIHEPDDVQNGRIARSGTVESPEPSIGKDLSQDKEPQEQAPVVLTTAISTRPRNIVYDAIVAATAANPAEGGKIGKAIKSIKAAAAEPLATLASPEARDAWLAGEIVKRARTYRERRPTWELTPTALATHWNRIPTWQSERGDGRMTAEEIARL